MSLGSAAIQFSHSKLKMKVIIKSCTMDPERDENMLAPAPSLRDWEWMTEFISADPTPEFESIGDFIGKPLDILTTYRGWTLHLSGGVRVTRVNPQTVGGNGCVSLPTTACSEMGNMIWKGAVYSVDIEYV